MGLVVCRFAAGPPSIKRHVSYRGLSGTRGCERISAEARREALRGQEKPAVAGRSWGYLARARHRAAASASFDFSARCSPAVTTSAQSLLAAPRVVSAISYAS